MRELRTVGEQLYAACRRRGAFVEHLAADERVDEAALAGIELADDDDEEELVEAPDRLGQGILIGGPAVEPRERALETSETLALLGEKRLVIRCQNAREHTVL